MGLTTYTESEIHAWFDAMRAKYPHNPSAISHLNYVEKEMFETSWDSLSTVAHAGTNPFASQARPNRSTTA